MEPNKDNLNYDISTTEIRNEDRYSIGKKIKRSRANKISKISEVNSWLNNPELITTSSTKDFSNTSKLDERQNRIIDEKWEFVDRSFQTIMEFGGSINIDIAVLVKKIEDLIKSINSSFTINKDDIIINPVIDETTALDIFLCDILSYWKNALSPGKKISQLFSFVCPLMIVLKELYYKKGGGLRRLIAPLFKGENTEKNELLKILKIDFFRKCLNEAVFSEKCLLKILDLEEKNLYTLDLNKIYLPFIDDERLMTFADFLSKIFESESFLQAMLITMNFQSKEIEYSKEEIRKSMSEIYKYLLNPVVFPNKEKSKLYSISCINLRLYLSSFVVENIQDKVKHFSLNFEKDKDMEEVDYLKEIILDDLSTGFEFAVLILTIVKESSHILRRHLRVPKVYFKAEAIELECLNEKIKETSEEKEEEPAIEHFHKKISDDGEILEYLLFGDNFEDLIIQEIQFLFNLDNWNKGMKNFRKDFANIRKLMDHRCTKTMQFINKISRYSIRGFCGNKRYTPCC